MPQPMAQMRLQNRQVSSVCADTAIENPNAQRQAQADIAKNDLVILLFCLVKMLIPKKALAALLIKNIAV